MAGSVPASTAATVSSTTLEAATAVTALVTKRFLPGLDGGPDSSGPRAPPGGDPIEGAKFAGPQVA